MHSSACLIPAPSEARHAVVLRLLFSFSLWPVVHMRGRLRQTVVLARACRQTRACRSTRLTLSRASRRRAKFRRQRLTARRAPVNKRPRQVGPRSWTRRPAANPTAAPRLHPRPIHRTRAKPRATREQKRPLKRFPTRRWTAAAHHRTPPIRRRLLLHLPVATLASMNARSSVMVGKPRAEVRPRPW